MKSKGLHVLIDILSKRKAENWQFTVVGEGRQRAKLESLTREHALQDRVRFIGQTANPAEYYRKAPLFVFPSVLESTGMVMLEAMSHGLPCLGFSSTVDGIENANDELIDHSNDGLLASSTDDFSRLLAMACRNSHLVAEMGEKARLKVSRHYDWRTHMDKWDEIILQASLNSSKGQSRVVVKGMP